MLKHLYKTSDGSLKTMRVSLTVFLAVLAAAWVLYGTNKAKDTLLIRVTEVLTPESPAAAPAITPAEDEPAAPKNTASQLSSPQESAQEISQPQAPETATLPEQSQVARSREPVPPEQSFGEEETPETMAEKNGESDAESAGEPEVSEPENDAMKQFNLRYRPDKPDAIELASGDYADMYTHWRKSGTDLDTDKRLVPLRIQNLENVFQLFQMKVVAVKDDVPFLDLMDRSRVAPEALSGYSSTCFLVSRPWEKWGKALADAGFSRNDRVEVRYYTYGFVRNAIYARAMKAFGWSLAAQELPATTSPDEADVLGRVYAVQQSGGGAFGVFVPFRVDFRSGASVVVDPLACFVGEPDVIALKQAGIL